MIATDEMGQSEVRRLREEVKWLKSQIDFLQGQLTNQRVVDFPTFYNHPHVPWGGGSTTEQPYTITCTSTDDESIWTAQQ